MPRTPKKPRADSTTPTKPYPTSSPDDKTDIKTTINNAKATAWTGEELVILFRFAMDRNGRDWGQAVEGRNASQARQTWA